jgi:hypothetical protein
MKNLYFIISFFTLTCSFSQYDTGDSNYVGLFAGVNKTDILSKNFDVKPLLGWNAALSVRGNYYNDFEMVYAIQFAKNNFAIPSYNLLLKNEEAKYTLTSVQISFQLSYPII